MKKRWISTMTRTSSEPSGQTGSTPPEVDQFEYESTDLEQIADRFDAIQTHAGRVGKQDLELSQLSFECGRIYADLKAINSDLRQILSTIKSI